MNLNKLVFIWMLLLTSVVASAAEKASDDATKTNAVVEEKSEEESEDAPAKKDKKKSSKKKVAAKESKDDLDDAFADEFKDEYGDEETVAANTLPDPLFWWNKGWFHFNDKLFFYALKPTAKGWEIIIPKPGRDGLRNVLINLQYPKRLFNNALQGRLKRAGLETGRFLINTTIGVVGIWDPATSTFHMERYDEDFDQTLAVWRIGQGVYLTWPFFGPSSIRGTFGLVLDSALNIVPGGGIIMKINDMSLGRDEYESLLKMAIDPYVTVRNAYVQNREKVIAE